MARQIARDGLALALADKRRVVLLQGLPRSGRSTFLRAWSLDQTGREAIDLASARAATTPVRIVDGLRIEEVADFIDMVRRADAVREDAIFVAAPADLGTLSRLHGEFAGRTSLVALDPLQPDEVLAVRTALGDTAVASADAQFEPAAEPMLADPVRHWLRGGLPESFGAESDRASFRWRRDLIDGLLARDYGAFDVTPATRLDLILSWTASRSGEELDLDKPPIGQRRDAVAALHVLTQIGLVRELRNWTSRAGRRGVKSKYYVRDTGLLHALQDIETLPQLRASGRIGASWETYAIESLLIAARGQGEAWFYRAAGDDGTDEIDLILDLRRRAGIVLAIECKTDPDARLGDGFARGMAATGADQGFIVHSGPTAIETRQVARLDLASACARVSQLCALD